MALPSIVLGMELYWREGGERMERPFRRVLKSVFAMLILIVASLSLLSCSRGGGSSPATAGLSLLTSSLDARPEDIHAFLLFHKGSNLVEAYGAPRTASDRHKLASCTKSVISMLIGIARDEAKIASIDSTLASWFPEASADWPEGKRRITLRHLLTMTDGLEWREDGSYSGSSDSFTMMKESPDALAFLLALPQSEEAGKRFYYNSGASHLLSSVLQKAVGMPAAEYAASRLFGPLGIVDFAWKADNQGRSYGCDGLFLRPADLLKLGILYLQGGLWEGKRILSRAWIEESTAKSVDSPGGLAGESGYGMQWWMNSSGGYSARGFGGQYLFVLPEEEAVVVFNASLESDFFLPERIVAESIIPTIKAGRLEKALAGKEFTEALARFERGPQALAVEALPPTARTIDGRRLVLEDGSVSVFHFPSPGEASWSLSVAGGPFSNSPLGLDGRPRRGDMGSFGSLPSGNSASLRGRWRSENVLVVEVRLLYDFYTYEYSFTFDGQGGLRETCFVPELNETIEKLSGRVE